MANNSCTFKKGHKDSEITRLKKSLAHIGKVPWNKGLTTETNSSIAIGGRKISAKAKNRPLTAQHKNNIRKGTDGKHSHTKGTHLTVLHKEKIRARRKGWVPSEITKQRMRESGKTKIFTEEHRKNIAVSKTGFIHAEDTRQKMSRTQRMQFELGIQTAHAPVRQRTYYNGITMKNSYEPKVAEWFDKNNIKWEYESKTCRFKLPTGRIYVIDFYLPELKCFVEVKGQWDEYSKYKVECVKAAGYDIRVIDNRNINSIALDKTDIPFAEFLIKFARYTRGTYG